MEKAPSEVSEGVFYIYDADCGICSWLAKKIPGFTGRLDIRAFGGYKPEFKDLGISENLCRETFLWVENGQVFQKSRAVFKAIGARYGLGWLVFLVSLPPQVWFFDWLYSHIAKNRHRISGWLGLNTCKIS